MTIYEGSFVETIAWKRKKADYRARGVMVIVVGNRHGDTSSNS